MSAHKDIAEDPWGWTVGLATLLIGLSLIRLTNPTIPFFDEVHYLPAARALLDGSEWLNREHPILGKEILAISIAMLGDNALGWRLPSVLFGGLTVFAAMRALWFASQQRFAVIAYGLLLLTGFYVFVQSRIAMLDIFMLGFFMVALWQCAAAVREPETGRWRLAAAGVALGLAMASKWNVAFLAMLPGLAFFAARLTAGRRRLLTSQRGIPVPGISLLEAALWLGLVPLLAYWLPHIWAYFLDRNPLQAGGFIAYHAEVMSLHESVTKSHPYQSQWYEWAANLRSIWYFYAPVEGVHRGIVLIGNPLTILAGLPALLWCAWSGITGRHWDHIAIIMLYAASLGMWAVVNKPVQFAYHYLLPSMFLFAALALALDALWRRGMRALPLTVLGAGTVLFVFFFPVLSAGAMDSANAFTRWIWLDSWL